MNKMLVLLLIALLSIGGVLAAGSESGSGSQPEDTGAIYSGSEETGGQGSQSANGTGTNIELETQNQGENSEIRAQTQVQTNNPGTGQMTVIRDQAREQVQVEEGYNVFVNNQGEAIQVKSENGFGLKVGQVEANSQLRLRANETESGDKVQATLSNGRNAEIKIMPDVASQRALERIGLNNCVAEEGCTIELKEVGKGEEVAPAYEVQAEAEGKFLGLFKTRAKVKTQVNAETGEIIRVKKPFLTSIKTTED